VSSSQAEAGLGVIPSAELSPLESIIEDKLLSRERLRSLKNIRSYPFEFLKQHGPRAEGSLLDISAQRGDFSRLRALLGQGAPCR